MKKSQPLPLVLLALVVLACTLQTQAAARPTLPTPTPSPAPVTATIAPLTPTPTRPPEPTPTRKASQECEVSTGTPGGWLNLRAGPGMTYQVRAVLQEGQPLVMLNGGAWVRVQTLSGQAGWVYAAFVECNP